MSRGKVVVAITGASGSIYAVRLLQVLLHAECDVHLVISGAARQVLQRELQSEFPALNSGQAAWRQWLHATLRNVTASLWGFHEKQLPTETMMSGELRFHAISDYSAGIASGSFLTRGMIICPCSMGTLSAIATGASMNLIHRAADVHLKERRPLVLVPRETPLSHIQLKNMTRVTSAGATVLPSMPGFYHQPQSIADLVDFIVGRICDHLQIPHQLCQRWGGSDSNDHTQHP